MRRIRGLGAIMTEVEQRQWHLEKKFSLTLIFAILLQSATAIWWASAINNRVEQVEKKAVETQIVHADKNKEQDARLLNLEDARQKAGERLSSIEASMTAIAAGVQRIDTRLERLTDQKFKTP